MQIFEAVADAARAGVSPRHEINLPITELVAPGTCRR
jgi:hypothetical protein